MEQEQTVPTWAQDLQNSINELSKAVDKLPKPSPEAKKEATEANKVDENIKAWAASNEKSINTQNAKK